MDAIKISKELKKTLIENNQLELTQSEVNEQLFNFIVSLQKSFTFKNTFGYGDQHINRYRMLSK